MNLPVSLNDIHDAAQRIAGVARRTPVLRDDALDERAGARIWIKPECLQVTGSFKIRGAMNRLAQLSPGQRRAGVVAFSSGNHAQGVARAARLIGCPAVIVMPRDAPQVKVDGVRADGGEIVLYDRETQSREDIAAQICEDRRAVLVPSFEDKHIIAGQGTVGLEVAQQLTNAGITANHYLCCTGGGGLISGSTLALRAQWPKLKAWAVEPEGHDDWRRSLETGTLQRNDPGVRSICDAILTPQPGDIPFRIGLNQLAGGLAISDGDVRAAMRFAFRRLKLVTEPGGAIALAAALRGVPRHMQDTDIVAVISGGNVDPALFAQIITSDG